MSYLSMLIHDVLLLNPTASFVGEDAERYGDEDLVFDAGVPSKARVEQESSNEDVVDRDTRVQAFKVFLPPDVPVTSLSLIEWEGRTFRVDGEPLVADSMLPHHHIEARCQEVLG